MDPTSERRLSPRARSLRAFLYFIGLIALVIGIFYAEEDARGRLYWNAFKHDWEAKGENFNPASIVPPAVPEDKNFALTPIVYTSYGNLLTRDGRVIPSENRDPNFVNRLNLQWEFEGGAISPPKTNGIGNWTAGRLSDLKPWQEYYRALAGTTNIFQVPPQPGTPAADVLLALSRYEPEIQDLREASLLPYSRFPLTYASENPSEILLPHLAAIKGCCLFLQIRAIAELQNGEIQKALDDIKLMLRLTDSIRTEPALISHLVRAAMLAATLQPVYEGLAQHKWSDPQLTEIDSELAKLDFGADYQYSMRSEVIFFQQGIFNYARRHPDQLFNFSMIGNNQGPPRMKSLGYIIPSGWIYENQTRCARAIMEYYVPIADTNHQTISPALANAANSKFEAEIRHVTPYNIAERMLIPALGNAAKRLAYAQGSVNLARTAIALEHFRLATGSYPATLDDLKSQHLPPPPHDVINGLPLHYSRTNGTSFLLYSVGWNQTDDGGQINLRNTGSADPSFGDWVWQYPAP